MKVSPEVIILLLHTFGKNGNQSLLEKHPSISVSFPFLSCKQIKKQQKLNQPEVIDLEEDSGFPFRVGIERVKENIINAFIN